MGARSDKESQGFCGGLSLPSLCHPGGAGLQAFADQRANPGSKKNLGKFLNRRGPPHISYVALNFRIIRGRATAFESVEGRIIFPRI
jgi:hypothetical protein